MNNCLLLHKKEQRLKLIDAGRAEMRNCDLSSLEKYQLSSKRDDGLWLTVMQPVGALYE